MQIVSYSGKITSVKLQNERVKKEAKLLETKEIKLLNGLDRADWSKKK